MRTTIELFSMLFLRLFKEKTHLIFKRVNLFAHFCTLSKVETTYKEDIGLRAAGAKNPLSIDWPHAYTMFKY